MKIQTFALMFFLLASLKFAVAQNAAPKENVKIIFTNQMTKDDLQKIKTEMKGRGVDLHYKKTSFTKDGKLKSLSFSVDFKDGYKGAANTGDVGSGGFGFMRDYSTGAKVPFEVGGLK